MTDQEYIKMILALDKSFFERWEWKEGDQFYIKGYGEDTHFIGDSVLFKKKPHYWKGYLVYGDWDYFKLIPILSQEQLQEMILNYQEKTTGNRFNEWKLIKEFYIFINSGVLKCVPEVYTARELWLQYLMNVVCDNVWNGTSWEKMK